MEIIFTDGSDKRFGDLCNELDEYLNCVLGGAIQRKQYKKYNTLDSIHDVVLIIENGEAVACGSFKQYEVGIAEILKKYIFLRYRQL